MSLQSKSTRTSSSRPWTRYGTGCSIRCTRTSNIPRLLPGPTSAPRATPTWARTLTRTSPHQTSEQGRTHRAPRIQQAAQHAIKRRPNSQPHPRRAPTRLCKSSRTCARMQPLRMDGVDIASRASSRLSGSLQRCTNALPTPMSWCRSSRPCLTSMA